MIIANAHNYREEVTALLDVQKLPTSDLPENMDNFLAAISGQSLIGLAGLEIYDEFGLLRSVAVQPGYRNLGIASQLINHIETLAKSKGLTALYLLTETAPDYFKKKGYVQVNRGEVPAGIKCSSEFSSVCRVSAIVLFKSL